MIILLTENYKNALKGFKAQAHGDLAGFIDGCEKEAQHIYRIVMTENVPVTDLDELMLKSFLDMEKSGEKDYSKSVDRDGLEYVDLEQDVEVTPYKSNGYPIEEETYTLSAIESSYMIEQLIAMGRLSLLTDTMQSLAQRKDGTQLQTAFPKLGDIKDCIAEGITLPVPFIEKINEWEMMSCYEVNFDFVQSE